MNSCLYFVCISGILNSITVYCVTHLLSLPVGPLQSFSHEESVWANISNSQFTLQLSGFLMDSEFHLRQTADVVATKSAP